MVNSIVNRMDWNLESFIDPFMTIINDSNHEHDINITQASWNTVLYLYRVSMWSFHEIRDVHLTLCMMETRNDLLKVEPRGEDTIKGKGLSMDEKGK